MRAYALVRNLSCNPTGPASPLAEEGQQVGLPVPSSQITGGGTP
jgi:hypothetical protein